MMDGLRVLCLLWVMTLGVCLPSSCSQGMYNDFGTKISNRLTTLIQKAVNVLDKRFDWSIYILPPDTRVEISVVDTQTVYSKSEYSLAIQA